MAALPKLTVSAGEHDRINCPVSVVIPVSYEELGNVDLSDGKTGACLACQLEPCRGGTRVTCLLTGIKAGETRKLSIKNSKVPALDRVRLVDAPKDGRLDVLLSGKRFTSYHYGSKWVRPFLHPIVGPYAVRVTRNWPIDRSVPGETRDHHHHKSLWVAHGECDDVNNWNEEPGHGYQRHRSFLSVASGPVYGEFKAKLDWCDAKDRKRFEETRHMRFYAVTGGEKLFDVSVSFRMTEKQVVFRDTKEGGLLSIRVASAMDVSRGGRIENAYGGVNEHETWGKSAPWCDYSGMLDGRHVGIAVMDHETNPRYPTGWHVRNYGLMTANCFAWSHYRPEAKVKGDMAFPKNSTTSWRYRIYVHKGDAAKGKVRNRFIDYIAPPGITVG